jgi:membrane-associated phospholipid phosphatase
MTFPRSATVPNRLEQRSSRAIGDRRQSWARGWLAEMEAIDEAVYEAVAGVATPRLDQAMRRLSTAANYSRISLAEAVLLDAMGGSRGRRAAAAGLASVALTSAVVNLIVKPAAGRARPARGSAPRSATRNITMPRSRSFPSGHAASAVAFASGAGREMPPVSVPLHLLAALIAYSRVHTGVHYPADVVAGAVIGSAVADIVASTVARRSSGSSA